MKKKIIVALIAFGFIFNQVGATFADTKPSKSVNQSNQLAAALPPSDGIVTLNTKRLVNDALPQIFSGNQPILNNISSKIDEIKSKIGIDLRQFEQVVVGFNIKTAANGKSTVEPVALTRGTFNAAALLAVGKIAANGKYREEKIGDKTIYVFSIADSVKKKNDPNKKDSFFDKMIGKMFDAMTKEFAVTAYNNDTLAFGTLARVRETLTSKTRVGNDILSLVNGRQSSMLNFAAKFPKGLSQIVNLDNDALGANLDGIRQLSGYMDVAGANTILEVMAKTDKPDQADNLQTTLAGLQSVFTNILLGSKGDDSKVYGRMLKNAKFTRTGSEVTINLQVPQTDVDVLIGKLK